MIVRSCLVMNYFRLKIGMEWILTRENTHTHAHAHKYTDRCEEPHKNGKYYNVFVDRLLDKANFRRLKHLCNVIRRKRQKHKRSKPLFSLITLIDWGSINAERRICWQYTVFLCTHNCFNNKNTRNWFLFFPISLSYFSFQLHTATLVFVFDGNGNAKVIRFDSRGLPIDESPSMALYTLAQLFNSFISKKWKFNGQHSDYI